MPQSLSAAHQTIGLRAPAPKQNDPSAVHDRMRAAATAAPLVIAPVVGNHASPANTSKQQQKNEDERAARASIAAAWLIAAVLIALITLEPLIKYVAAFTPAATTSVMSPAQLRATRSVPQIDLPPRAARPSRDFADDDDDRD